jgi:uncharacterized membrane protein YsdA (DUF1294 family)
MLGQGWLAALHSKFPFINNRAMRTFLFLVFAGIFGGAVYMWHMPPLVAVIYVVVSIVCFGVYAVDKAAAKAGRWRTSESTLLLLGLACGWPGAMLAQALLRHKASKASFRARFSATVALNIAVFAYLVSPLSVLRH